MPDAIRIGITEDFEPACLSHCATNAGLYDSSTALNIPLVMCCLPMPSVEDRSADEILHDWHGVSVRRFAIAILLFMVFGLIAAGLCHPAEAQSRLAVELQQKIDQVAADTLTKTQEPSASIAVVKDGEIAYLHAYGSARLDPPTPRPEMRYSIGSISKQFTVTAILLLQEQSKLSIDDEVGKFVPGLTQGNKVTIRQLLSHTSGYQDFYAPDYLLPMMLQPTTALKTVDLWARKPLDFEPGTKWQYSNTNYTIAGLIVEKASGVPLLQFLQEKGVHASRYEERHGLG